MALLEVQHIASVHGSDGMSEVRDCAPVRGDQMSRYMDAIALLIELRKYTEVPESVKAKIALILTMPESEGEQAIRECDEMLEEAARMVGGGGL